MTSSLLYEFRPGIANLAPVNFEQQLPSDCDAYYLCDADPTDATTHTINNFPGVKCNTIILRINNRPVTLARVNQVIIKIARKVPGDPATGNVTVAIADLPGIGTRIYTDEALEGFLLEVPPTGGTPSITITFSGSSINLKAYIFLAGKST